MSRTEDVDFVKIGTWLATLSSIAFYLADPRRRKIVFGLVGLVSQVFNRMRLVLRN